MPDTDTTTVVGLGRKWLNTLHALESDAGVLALGQGCRDPILEHYQSVIEPFFARKGV